MSHSQPGVIYFQVFAPYKMDEGLRQRIEAVHGEHVLRLTMIHAEAGSLRCGGPYMSPESLAAGAEVEDIGSAFVFKEKSYEAVRQIIESDPYYIHDVWDKEKLVIVPFNFFFGD